MGEMVEKVSRRVAADATASVVETAMGHKY